MSLDLAPLALERGDFSAAVKLLWPLWAQTRDPTVARALVLADQAASPLPETWRQAKRAKLHAVWLAAAEEPLPPWGWLGATWSQGTMAQSIERLELLARAPLDPRIALAIGAALVSPPFHGWSAFEPLYEPLIAALQEWKEPATLLQAQRSLTLSPWTGEQMAALVTPAIRTLAQTLAKTSRFTPIATPRLVDAVKPLSAAWPELMPVDDVPALQVVADALEERGDPRGAVLAAQLSLARGQGDQEKTEALTEARNLAQAKVAKRARKEKDAKATAIDKEARLVRDEAELEVLLQDGAKWRAKSLVIADAVLTPRSAARLATHRGLAKLERLGLQRSVDDAATITAMLEALDQEPLRSTLQIFEVQALASGDEPLEGLARWLQQRFFRGPQVALTARRLVVPGLHCTLTRTGELWQPLRCITDLAEGRPDYASLFQGLDLSPNTPVFIEREWMQEPRKSKVLEAARAAKLALTIVPVGA